MSGRWARLAVLAALTLAGATACGTATGPAAGSFPSAPASRTTPTPGTSASSAPPSAADPAPHSAGAAAARDRWGVEPASGPEGWSRGAVGLGAASFVRGHGFFVVAGERHGGVSGSGHVLLSADGRHWDAVLTVDMPPGAYGSARMDQVIVTSTGFAAWGSQTTTGVHVSLLYTAGLDGRTWTRAADAVGARAPRGQVVKDGRGGWVGLDSLDSTGGPRAVVRSRDGVHWERAAAPALEGLSLHRPFVTRSGRLVALGTEQSGSGSRVVWVTSDDLAHWQLHRDEDVFAGLHDDEVSLSVGAEDDRGLLVLGRVGADERARAAWWRSTDEGVSWRRLPLDASVFAGARVLALTGAGHGLLVASGASAARARVAIWTSHDDGGHWRQVTPDATFFDGPAPAGSRGIDVQLLDDTLLVSAEYADNKPLVDPLLHDLGSLR